MPRLGRGAFSVALALSVVACQRSPQLGSVGEVESIDSAIPQIVIRHAEIAGVLEAGATRFAVSVPNELTRISPGTRVRFEFHRAGAQFVITQLSPLEEGRPGVHDHTPHHGGVVAMVGMLHLEAVAMPDGRVRAYLTDVWRRPLPLAGVHGSVTLGLPGAKQTLPLAEVRGALEATGLPPATATVPAHFVLTRSDGPSVDMNFVLPVTPGSGGAVGVPADGCQPPAPREEPRGGALVPRCTMQFSRPITALAVTPDMETLLVAAVDLGVSVWRLPAGQLVRSFAQPPPVRVPIAEAPHAETVNDMAVRADGGEAVVAIEGRLLRYAINTGEVVGDFKGPGGVVRAVAWSPDGTSLLVSAFYDAAARLLSAHDGHELRRFAVEREGAAVAFAPNGQLVAIGSETGPIAVYDAVSGVRVQILAGPRGPTQALVFDEDRLISAGDDGAVRIWAVASGRLLSEVKPGGSLTHLAMAAGAPTVASAGVDGTVTLVDLQRGAVVDSLKWHAAQVLGLASAGPLLVSGDAAGELALWDVGKH